MTVRSESHGTVAAAPQAVYEYLADAPRWPEWAPAILECGVRGGGPMLAGATLEQRAKATFGGSRPRTLDITATDAPNRLTFAGMMGPSPMRWGFELLPDDGGTAVMLWLEADFRGVMVLLPRGLFRRMVRQVNEREIGAIGSALGRAPGAAQPQPG